MRNSFVIHCAVSTIFSLFAIGGTAAQTEPSQQGPEQKVRLNQPFRLYAQGVSVCISAVKFKIGDKEQEAWLYKTSGMASVKQPELFVLVLKPKFESEDFSCHASLRTGGESNARTCTRISRVEHRLVSSGIRKLHTSQAMLN